jgi:hypothetical protein
VKNYIDRQAEHQKKEDFKSEYLRLLRAHEIEFEERYVFDCQAWQGEVPLPLWGRIVR